MILELTPAQRDIYLEGKLFGKVVNNIGGYQVYRCKVDVARFVRARTWLLQSNDAYRLRFHEINGDCVPFIGKEPPATLRIVDCASESLALAWIKEQFETPFADISTAVFEDALLRLSPDEYWYFAKAHHLIMDGWGFALQMQRFLGLYKGLGSPVAATTDACPPRPSFIDYMRAQSGYRSSEQYTHTRDYWLARHAGAARSLFVPLHALETARSGRASIVLSPALIESLRQLATGAKANLVTVMYAALYVYFSRCYQRNDITIGSPVHNRRSAVDKDTIGSTVNVNAHRLVANAEWRFIQLVEHVASVLRQDHRHSRFPLGDLIRALRETQGATDEFLYEIAFNYQKLNFELSIDDQPVDTHYLSHFQERVPLTFVLCEYGSQDMRLHLDYACGYFDEHQAQALLGRLMHLLGQVAEQSDGQLAEYNLLPPAEWRDQFVNWQGANVPLRQDACIQDFFEEQVLRTPDRIAVTCGQASLTYAKLNQRANRLAHRLIDLGAAPSRMVGICHSRSLDLLIAILAVLKSGSAYVPIDPAYPATRIQYFLDDAQPGIVLVDEQGAKALGSYQGIVIHTGAPPGETLQGDGACPNPARSTTSLSEQDIAYVVYTSGSTGRPKGVMIEHRNTAAFIQWGLASYSANELAAVLASTSICFDLSIFELFVPLAMGGRVVLVKNILDLKDRSIDELSLVNTVPSAIRGLLDARAIPASVRCINLAGEFLQQELVDALYSQLGAVKVCDLYGPSESTTYSTGYFRLKGGTPNIGRPIQNTQAYVLDHSGNPLPTGMIGELYIGGAGLARGYLHQPMATAEKFVFNRHVKATLYSTGDLVRLTADGNLQYQGRKDNQEKIRGHRVEPGEIEACLLEHPLMADCVVVGRAGAEGRFLVAYVVAAQPDVDMERFAADLGEFTAARLPSYMVPSQFVTLSALPLTPNGKVDRRALPAPADTPSGHVAYVGPRSDIEQRLSALWQATLQQERIGIRDDFVKRGGDSLLLLRLASSIESEFDLRIDLSSLFASPTIEMQGRLLAQQLEFAQLRQAVSNVHAVPSSSYIDL